MAATKPTIPAETAPTPSGARLRLLLLVGTIGLFALGYYSGAFDLFLDPARLKAQLVAWGPWAYLLFILSFVVMQPLPGVVFVIAAALVWPGPLALTLSMTGAIANGIAGFLFARYLARSWVARHLPARFHRFDARLEENAFKTVVLMRFVFFLAPPVNWAFGLSRVGFWPFVLGSVVGVFPGVAAFTFLGRGLVQWLALQPPLVWAGLALVIVGLVALRRIRKRRRQG